MVKHLTIIYDAGSGPSMLFDGDIEELVFTDTANGCKVEGRLTAAKGGGQGAGLLDLLSKASKASTQKTIDQKRETASD